MRLQTLVLLAAAILAGCTSIVGGKVDDLERNDDLRIHLEAFGPHTDEFVSGIVVGTGGTALARVTIDPLPDVTYDVEMSATVPPGVTRLDLWADDNGNRMLDSTEHMEGAHGDHAWRLTLDDGSVDFIHDTNFTNILEDNPATLLRDFRINITDAEAMAGEKVVLKLFVESGAQIGLYELLSAPAGGTVSMALEGIIDSETGYEAEIVFADQICEVDRRTNNADLIIEATLDDICRQR